VAAFSRGPAARKRNVATPGSGARRPRVPYASQRGAGCHKLWPPAEDVKRRIKKNVRYEMVQEVCDLLLAHLPNLFVEGGLNLFVLQKLREGSWVDLHAMKRQRGRTPDARPDPAPRAAARPCARPRKNKAAKPWESRDGEDAARAPASDPPACEQPRGVDDESWHNGEFGEWQRVGDDFDARGARDDGWGGGFLDKEAFDAGSGAQTEAARAAARGADEDGLPSDEREDYDVSSDGEEDRSFPFHKRRRN
jgi:hypothetical protein